MGSRPTYRGIDPVTTDPVKSTNSVGKGEIVISEYDTSTLSNAGFSKSRDYLAVYISGYADGEGCFSVSIRRRSKLRVGWEVRPSFSVAQKRGRTEVLNLMLQYFRCGTLRYSSTDDTEHYETRSITDISKYIVPHFEKYPLLSSKQRDFEIFKTVCEIIKDGKHLQILGLQQILILTASMPHISLLRRDYLESIVSKLNRE